MNWVRDDIQQRLGQEAAPKRTSVQWKHNSLQRVTVKNWEVINQRLAVRIVRKISWPYYHSSRTVNDGSETGPLLVSCAVHCVNRVRE
jgi:hypothetical protein